MQSQPTLVEQVVNAIVSEIVDGELPSNSRLIQDDLARAYGVSRQPVQQALLLLRDRGLVREAPGRGLIVSPIDPDFVRKLYEMRATLDGLAARLAAERGAARAKIEGPAFLEMGRAAVARGSLHVGRLGQLFRNARRLVGVHQEPTVVQFAVGVGAGIGPMLPGILRVISLLAQPGIVARPRPLRRMQPVVTLIGLEAAFADMVHAPFSSC